MKIVFNTWPAAFFHPGGGEVQLLNSRAALEQRGCLVELYNQWKPQQDLDIFHQFSVQLGGNYVVDAYKNLDKKVALSTILWSTFSKDDFFYWQIGDLFRKADILFTNSDAESSKIASDFDIPLNKFHKTRNSVGEEYFSNGDPLDFRKRYGIDDEFILTVGNVDQRKNTKLLVEACKKTGLKLVVIGAIRDEAYFDSFKGLWKNALFLGPVANVELIRSAYRACRLFVLPSLCETPGIAALEAASQGARVVITTEGPTEEYLGSYAIYVDPSSLESVVEGIKRGLQTTVDGTQATYIRDNFTWKKTADDIYAGYVKIVGKK